MAFTSKIILNLRKKRRVARVVRKFLLPIQITNSNKNQLKQLVEKKLALNSQKIIHQPLSFNSLQFIFSYFNFPTNLSKHPAKYNKNSTSPKTSPGTVPRHSSSKIVHAILGINRWACPKRKMHHLVLHLKVSLQHTSRNFAKPTSRVISLNQPVLEGYVVVTEGPVDSCRCQKVFISTAKKNAHARNVKCTTRCYAKRLSQCHGHTHFDAFCSTQGFVPQTPDKGEER